MTNPLNMPFIGDSQTLLYYADQSVIGKHPSYVAMDVPTLSQVSSDRYLFGDYNKECICLEVLKLIALRSGAHQRLDDFCLSDDWRYLEPIGSVGECDEIDLESIAHDILQRCIMHNLYTVQGRLRYGFYRVQGSLIILVRRDLLARMVRDETAAL